MTSIDWEPALIDECEEEFLVTLQIQGKVELDSKNLEELLKRFQLNRENFLQSLVSKRLISVDEGFIQLLVERLMIVNWDGKTFAGDDIKGKMSRWLQSSAK